MRPQPNVPRDDATSSNAPSDRFEGDAVPARLGMVPAPLAETGIASQVARANESSVSWRRCWR